MKISKRVREEAALLCAIAACEPKLGSGRSLTQVGFDLDADEQSIDLALAVKNHVYEVRDDGDYEVACAEAECLLRTGWSPK